MERARRERPRATSRRQGVGVAFWALAALVLQAPTGSAETRVYEADFEQGVGPEWGDHPVNETSPSCRQYCGKYLGRYGDVDFRFRLHDLPAHDRLRVEFDLFIVGSWDGNGENGLGPDRWSLAADGRTLLETSFSNICASCTQDYPNPASAAHAGAAAVDQLGYTENGGDAVYHLSFTLNHTGDDLALAFDGTPSQHVDDESWGLDNVLVAVEGRAGAALPVVPILVVGGATIAATAGFFTVRLHQGARWAWLALMGPLYTRLSRDEILEHGMREAIYGYVEANPGVHLRGIQQGLGLKYGTLTHHVRFLQKQQFLRAVRDGMLLRFYPVGTSLPIDPRDPLAVDVGRYVAAHPGCTNAQIAQNLGRRPSLIHYHVERLVQTGRVRKERSGKEVRLVPSTPAA